MWVRLFIAIIPIARQMMLEIKARINQSNTEVKNSEGTATGIAVTIMKLMGL